MLLNKITRALLVAALAVGCAASAFAATTYGVPKREFRSAWVATVWGLDWPQSVGTDATKQKQQMDRLLDSLQVNNFNAVNFQVRSMCDAMYQSSYEPWSSYLTGTRGQRPSYDPLQYVVEGCHKRGMECHAWINPYRFSTGSNWNTAQDEALKSDGHLLTHGTTVILDPAQQWTIDRIVNVCKEIISNYDVDGILYDDYFYPDGIPATSEADDYTEWQQSGTSLSFGDWRRDNVNRMVQAVYQMIQQTRPEVRFGISPAGVAATSSSVASKYGVTPCPSGSDWQYNGIFSDPLAWLSSQHIDYISPQVYWQIGANADYGKITPWWNQVSAKFGRHCYISQNIYTGINKSSDADDYQHVAQESELNRTSSVDGNPGAIYYSCKYLYALGAEQSLANYLKGTVFSRPALPPVMTWKTGSNPGPVTNLRLTTGDQLSWQGHKGVRYSVYAFPAEMNTSAFNGQVDYLLGMSYDSTYALPASRTGSDWQYAVCVVDRMGNEYEPVFLGTALEQLAAPALLGPASGDSVNAPFQFAWTAVPGAQRYVVELSADSTFSNLLESVTTTQTAVSCLQFSRLTHETPVYWRVQAKASGYYSGMSETRQVTPLLLTVTYPADGEEEVAPGFTATWYAVGSHEQATVQLANDPEFTSLAFTSQSATGSLVIPVDSIEAGNTYYLRVQLTVDGQAMTSPVVQFTVAHAATSFVQPRDGGIIVRGQHIAVKPQVWATSYVVEVSTSATTWGRTRFVETLRDGQTQTTLPADSIKVSGKVIAQGRTYYARTRSNYLGLDGTTHVTGWSHVISFTYRDQLITGDLDGDGQVNTTDVTLLVNAILGGGTDARYDIDGNGLINTADVTALVTLVLQN